MCARPDVRLQLVSADGNHNKFYEMHDNGDNYTFTTRWGREGSAGQTKTDNYIWDWDKIYYSKINKGYDDITANKTKTTVQYASISDAEIDKLLKSFLECSRQYVSQFTSTDMISQRAADEAQRYINLMAKHIDVSTDLNLFNSYLIELFKIIPRKMKKVEEALCHDLDKRHDFVVQEQSLLDNLINMTQVAPSGDDSDKKTIEESFTFTLSQCSPEEIDFIKNKLKSDGFYRYKFNKAWKINTPARELGFQEYLENNNLKDTDKNVKMYWHGTGTENVLSILSNGLLIKPSNSSYSGSMFGLGIYTAPNADKASGYTSIAGSYWKGGSSRVAYMFISAVITGKPFKVKDNYETYGGIRICNLDGDKFSSANLGCHSVYAKAGTSLKRDECIVYNQNQVACRYLVEFVV